MTTRRSTPPACSAQGACLVVLAFLGLAVLLSACTPTSTSADLEFRLDSVTGAEIRSGDLIDFGTLSESTTSASPGSRRTVYIALPPEVGVLDSVDLVIAVENADTIWDGTGFFGQGGQTTYQGSLIPGASNLGSEVYVQFAGDLAQDNWAAANGVKTGALVITDGGVELLRADLKATVAKATGFVRAVVGGDAAAQAAPARVYAFQSADSRLRAAGVSEPLGGGAAGSVVLGSFEYSGSSWGIAGSIVAVPNGDYHVECFVDLDEDTYLGVGEPVTFRHVVVDGNTSIELDGNDFAPAFEPSFAVVNAGALPDGTLIVRFLAPGTGDPKDPRYYVGLYTGTLSAGSLTPLLVGALPAGTYDLSVHLDVDGGVDLGAYPPVWDVDTGDRTLAVASVTVTGVTVSLDGSSFASVP